MRRKPSVAKENGPRNDFGYPANDITRGTKPNIPKPLERDITKAIRDYLRLHHVWHWKFNPGPFGNQEGVSDIIGVLKVRVDELMALGIQEIGVFMAIEVKRPGSAKSGKTWEAQMRFIDNVQKKRGIGFMAYSVDDVATLLPIANKRE
jgi:hypothetical protein